LVKFAVKCFYVFTKFILLLLFLAEQGNTKKSSSVWKTVRKYFRYRMENNNDMSPLIMYIPVFLYETCCEYVVAFDMVRKPLYDRHPMLKFSWTNAEETDTVSYFSHSYVQVLLFH